MSNRFGIRPQVVLLVAVPLLFLMLALVLTILLQRDTEQTAARARHATDILAESDGIFRTLTLGGRGLSAYVKSRNAADLAPYRAAVAALPAHFRTLDGLVAGDPVMTARAKDMEAGARGIVRIWALLVRDFASGGMQKVRALTMAASTQHVVTVWQRSKLLLDASERSRMVAAFGVLRAQLRLMEALLVGLTALGVLLTLLVATGFGLRLVSRLRRLADNSRRLAAGEPAAPLSGNDEIADLDHVYRELATCLMESLRLKDKALAAYEREHRVATVLQRALLPQDFPSVHGLRIDATYVPASESAEIGGDWYDVFELPENRIGLSVGDVAGHGLRAATTMGTVRQSIRNAARFETAPSAVFRHVNQTLCSDDTGVVTAFFGVLDLDDGTLQYSLAGHPAPIVVQPFGTVEFLEGHGIVLGFDPRTPFVDFEVKLDVGSGLVLFTDGIVEIERDYFKGMEDLVEAVSLEYFNPSPNIAEGIQRRASRGLKARDDAAILFIGITSLGADALASTQRRWSFEACDEAAARRMKRAVLWQLAGLASTSPEFGEVEAILGELLSNVVRHSPGEATILMEPRGGEMVLHVDDHGRPFELNGRSKVNPFSENGRGLLIVGAFARDLSVTRQNGGNRVSVVLPLPEEFSVRP